MKNNYQMCKAYFRNLKFISYVKIYLFQNQFLLKNNIEIMDF